MKLQFGFDNEILKSKTICKAAIILHAFTCICYYVSLDLVSQNDLLPYNATEI